MKHSNIRECLLRLSVALTVLASATRIVVADDFEMWVQCWGVLDSHRLCDYEANSGQLLCSYRDGAVLWDVRSGLALRRYLPLADSSSMTDQGCLLEQQILLGGTHFVSLLDKQSGRLIRSFDLDGDPLSTLSVNRSSTLLAASTLRGKLFIWEIATGRRLHVIDAQRILGEMEFSPDSRLLLCGGDENVATLWNVETGEIHDRLNAPTGIHQVAFSDDGRRMLTGGSEGYWHTPRLIVWDVASLTPEHVIPRSALDASFVGPNVRIVLPGGEVEFWSPDRHEAPPSPAEWPRESEGKFRVAGITRNHWVIRSPRDNSQVWLVGPEAGESAIQIRPEAPRFTADDHFPLAISPDGRTLLTGGATHGNRPSRSAIWNLHDGRVQLELENESVGAFHPDGKRLALARGRTLVVLHMETGQTLQTLELKPDDKSVGGAFTSLRFTPDGKRLLGAHGDWYGGNAGAILLWDIESGKLLRDYATDTKAVMFAELSRDEKWILAALTPGDDGSAGVDQLSVIDAVTGEVKKTRMFNPNGFTAGPTSVETGLVAGRSIKGTFFGKFYDGENALFRLTDISPKAQLPESSRPAAFSHDGQVVACFESKQILGLRASDTGILLHAYPTQLHSIRPMVFLPDQTLVCGALFDPWHHQESKAIGVGFEDFVTAKVEAELTLFREPGSWLVSTRDGSVNGSDKALSRISWRRPDSIDVIRDPARTQRATNPQRVAAAVSQPRKEKPSIRDLLKGKPHPVIPESRLPESPGSLWFKNYHEREREAGRAFREAGAEVQTNIHDQMVSIRFEQRPVTAEVLKQLRWGFSLGRLDLADAGIHDEELDLIGLLPSLQRLSLSGNSITDRGVIQLAGLWKLEVLDVHNTQVTAAGLNSLRLLPNLRLVIAPDSIQLDDIAALRERHPDLEVIRKSGRR